MKGLEDVSNAKLKRIKEKPSAFVEIVLNVEPFDYQKNVLDADSNRVAFVSGRQVGKSRTASWIALHKAITSPDSVILITAPTQRQSSELFAQVRKEMNKSNLDDSMWGAIRTTRTEIEFVNGSRILCLPAGDDGSTIRGYTADLIIVDEAAFIPDEVFHQALSPMMAVTDGKMVLLSTPFGASGFLYEAFHGKLSEDWFTERVPTYRNPLVGEKFISEQQDQLSSIDFKQEILGQFEEAANSYFPAQLIDDCVEGSLRRNAKATFLGADIARHGEDSTVLVSMDGNGNVFDIEVTKDKNIIQSVAHIKERDDNLQYDRMAIDETALGGGIVDILKSDLRSHSIEGVTFSIEKKRDIYNNLKTMMEAGKINLPDHNGLKAQLLDMEYEFTRRGKMKIHAKNERHDDIVDALALCAWAAKQGSRVRQTSSSTF